MTVTRIQLSQLYVQDEHQRMQQTLTDNIAQLQAQVVALQAIIKILKAKAGVS